MPSRRVKVVKVTWDDIAGYGPEWKEAHEVEACSHVSVVTVGFLWSSRGKNLKIVGTITEDGGVGDINVIPKGVVRKTRVLDTVTVQVSKKEAKA